MYELVVGVCEEVGDEEVVEGVCEVVELEVDAVVLACVEVGRVVVGVVKDEGRYVEVGVVKGESLEWVGRIVK